MIHDNYSISRLFITKDVTIFLDGQDTINIHLKPIKDFFLDSDWLQAFHLFTLDITDLQKMDIQVNSPYNFIEAIVFDWGIYKQYKGIAGLLRHYLEEIVDKIEFDIVKKQMIVNQSIIITPEIWDYIVYLLKLSWGEKVSQPLTFNSPEERAFYLKQKEYEEKIKNIKSSKEGDKDGLIKALLAITYSFPSFTLDYLYNQTMAQIHWLQGMAAGEVSYRINAEIAASGNMKKGKKLEFFIK